MVEQVGEITREQLDRVGTRRLVRTAMTAAVVGQHRPGPREPLGHWLPEQTIHRQRVDEHNPVRAAGACLERMAKARAIARDRHAGRRPSHAWVQVWRTLLHANNEPRQGGPREDEGQRGPRSR